MSALRSAALPVGVIAGAYLLGSIPWSYLVVRWLRGADVRAAGSGNAGATNVLRLAGKGPGALALFLDFSKGAVAVAASRALGASVSLAAGAAIAVTLGHVFPIFLGLRGGKGVATGAGAMAILAPIAVLVAAVVFIVVVWVRHMVSLGSLAAAATLPFAVLGAQRWGWLANDGPSRAMAAAAIATLVVACHRSNLRRLWRGTERRLGRVAASETQEHREP